MPRIPFTRGSFNVEYELCLLKNDSDAALEPIGEVLEHAPGALNHKYVDQM